MIGLSVSPTIRAGLTNPASDRGRRFRISQARYGQLASATRTCRAVPFPSLHAFHVDRSDREQFYLRLRSEHLFAPLHSIPIHKDVTVEVEKLLAAYLREEHIQEPLSNRIFTIIGL